MNLLEKALTYWTTYFSITFILLGSILGWCYYNLKNKNHGNLGDISNSHTGDLINNIHADTKGNFKYSYVDPRLTLTGNINNSIIGCSVVIHDGIDDLGLGGNAESLKTGNAGARLACSIIGKSKDS
jgi:Cu-Zn family superoxide dismutase